MSARKGARAVVSAEVLSAEVLALEADTDAVELHRPPAIGATPSISAVRDAWLATFAASGETRRSYRGALERFERWAVQRYGQLDADSLTLHGVAEYHAHLADPAAGRSSSTIKKERAAVNSLIRWASDQGFLDRQRANLALSVKLPKAARERDVPKALSEAHARRLVIAARAEHDSDPLLALRDSTIIELLLGTGLRANELCELRRCDVVSRRQGAKARDLIVHGKGDRQRRVPLATPVAGAVRRWDRARAATLGPAGPSAPLFCSLGRRRRDGSYPAYAGVRLQPWTLNELVGRLGAAIGLDSQLAHPHALRHTFATRYLADPDADVAQLRVVLGHADIKTTSIYLTVRAHQVDGVVERMAVPDTTLDGDHAARAYH